jgi:hypothetical protein
MERQTVGLLNLYYPYSLWNFRRFNNRRLKTLHIVGCYNTVIMVFLITGKLLPVADNGRSVLLICAVSFMMALFGLAVEMPGLACYFEKLGSLRGKPDCGKRYPILTLGDLRPANQLPVHHAGILFYILLMLLWLFLFFAALGQTRF